MHNTIHYSTVRYNLVPRLLPLVEERPWSELVT
jgi:hypothetical protein